MTSRSAEERYRHPGGLSALWGGVLIAPFAWLLHLGLGYALVRRVCETGATWWLHLLTGLTLVMALGGIWLAARNWRATGGGVETWAGDVEHRSRFMAIGGLVAGVYFALIIVLAWLAVVLLHPCWE